MSVLRVPAMVEELDTARQFVRDQARMAGVDPGAVSDIVQAVDESFTNAILHGYRGGNGTVEVEVDHAGRLLIVRLRDQAPPFDPTLVPTPDTSVPLEERPLGGMGVFLARELMDTVTYERTKEGNELTLVKECITTQGGRRC